MSKRPSFQFYPPDWRNDPGLRLCSMAARGLWIEMMCLMHEGEPYGHLTLQGRPLAPDSLSRLVGESPAQVKRWLRELADNEVYSVAGDGSLFSRRMVRDEELRDRRAAGGEAGGKHGNKGGSHGSKGGRPAKPKTPHDGKSKGGLETPLGGEQKPPPSSSSPSPSSEEGSVDKSTAQIVPISDPEKVMFDSGVRLLASAGITEARARPMLGKWRRDHGSAAVIEALGAAQRLAVIDPVSFIEGRWRADRNRNGGTDELEMPFA